MDRTFQDVGGWLVEIVDEDPARGWISFGGQICKEISSIVVPSRDMIQFNPLEFVLELAHLLVVCCHEGAFARGLLLDLVDDKLQVTTDVEPHSAELDGDAQSIDECLIFGSVV